MPSAISAMYHREVVLVEQIEALEKLPKILAGRESHFDDVLWSERNLQRQLMEHYAVCTIHRYRDGFQWAHLHGRPIRLTWYKVGFGGNFWDDDAGSIW